jgi:hypothetical protein
MNGKFGTCHIAHIAAGALFTVSHADNVVTLTVGLIGLVQQVLRAKLYTESAPFASFCINNDPVLVGFRYAVAQDSLVITDICWQW